MTRNHAFTLTELCASCVLALLLVGLTQTIVGCGDGKVDLTSDRGKSMMMKSHTQLRGIGQGFLVYSTGNNSRYPGMNAQGEKDTTALPPGSQIGTNSTNGFEPVYRLTVLVRNSYVTPEFLISPFEETSRSPATADKPLSTANFSYALLRIDQPGSGRQNEWKETMNSMAVIASDRNIAAAARKDARSPMSDIDAWIGGVVYNDNHVSTEEQSVIAETKYGPYRTKNDDLFADNNDEQGNPNNDAVMVYQDATTYVNQK